MGVMNLQTAVGQFLAELAVSHSEATVRTYRTGLTQFVTACGDKQVRQLNMSDAIRFAQGLGEVATSTRHTYLAAVTRLYRWLVLEGHSDLDLGLFRERMSDLRGPAAKRLPRLPHNGDAERVVQNTRTLPEATTDRLELLRLRDLALIETLRSTGARVSEIAGLTRRDLDSELSAAIVTGKGSKQRMIYFDPAAWNALDAYLAARADRPNGKTVSRLPVFARHDRRANGIGPMSTDSIREALANLCKIAGVEPITPHQFRHRFATRILGATGDLAATQDLLGHATPATTRVYAQVANQRARAAHRAANL